ncbi:hypothetical protein TVAG_382990 [Trichomonas vaginalis G3]|uniref:Uncharacterized protein n=1 Tax=Trichomonas vaginalis (strain ATCC PRA-98 / G3) TaxID=412133 RepID=A2FJM7_TRIV3|nr:armadillo (ARM) repeat-containing protein family [Trichomonas vaginalis G3]EAX94914.1 hypothetical protein TVAG_382990 [Trichomonas vaginalis G3]KAI5482429.1 armadillo (ARM) repeat-containing protein family [Trichomonas vaginalis G3]|eukprot:XP_001307844.1 hypothetical protein [Trichomonas vaginalis G3]
MLANPGTNGLLPMIVRFLNTRDTSIEKLQNFINESTTEQLVPSFAFLGFWLTSNITSNSDPSTLTSIQSAFHLIDLIISKVPPVILLSGISDLNWGMNQPSWTLSEFFQPVFERIRKIRGFVKPFSLESHILRYPQIYITGDKAQMLKFPGLLLEVEADPAYQIACIQHFKRLILNHAPLDSFKPLTEYRNARLTLTYAIMDLISELNSNRKATHSELLFTFATIFLYVQGFALSNDIDGQILCEFLQSRPFISPFCMLAIVNHIQFNHYLFNLLIPSQLTKGDIDNEQDAIAAIESQYRIVDMSTDDSLSSLISYIPSVLARYFLSNLPPANDKDLGKNKNETIAFMLLTCKVTLNQIKYIVENARDNEYGPKYVAIMSSQLMTLFIFGFHHTFSECCKNKMFTPNLMTMIECVLANILPIRSETIAKKFLDLTGKDIDLQEMTIRAIFFFVRIIAPLSVHKTVIPSVLQVIGSVNNQNQQQNDSGIEKVALVLLIKLLHVHYPRLSDEVAQKIEESSNILVLLAYIEATTNLTDVNLCTEATKINEFREKLISILPFNNDKKAPIYIIESINQSISSSRFDKLSLGCLRAYKNFSQSSNMNASELFDVYFLSFTSFVARYEFAYSLTQHCRRYLASNDDILEKDYQLQITTRHLAVLLSQQLLPRLLYYKHEYLANILIDALIPALLADKMPLHWFKMFLTRNWHLLTSEMSAKLKTNFLGSIPNAQEYLVPDGPEMAKQIGTKLHEIEETVQQDPEVIVREYQSQFDHMKAFSVCAILLSNKTCDAIVDELINQIVDVMHSWPERELCCNCLMRVIAELPHDICTSFFTAAVHKSVSPIILKAMRIFMTYVTLEVFRDICYNLKQIISGDPSRLSVCLQIMMSNFMRLKGDSAAATSMLCGFLENVSLSTPKDLQEEVIDAVGLTYITLKLHKSRPVLINASSRFPPEMKSIIASSLEITSPAKKNETAPYMNPKVQNFSSLWV